MAKKQAFLSETETTPKGDEKKHLRVVISDWNSEKTAMVVSVTTWKENRRGQDNSCILEAGEHNFIVHKSWVDYTRTKAMSFDEVYNGLKRGLLVQKSDVSESVLLKMQNGAKKSVYLPQKFESFFEYF